MAVDPASPPHALPGRNGCAFCYSLWFGKVSSSSQQCTMAQIRCECGTIRERSHCEEYGMLRRLFQRRKSGRPGQLGP